MRRRLPALLLVVASAALADTRSFVDRSDLPAEAVRSGSVFLTAETRALQADGFANPGYLWVERGRELFDDGDKACSSCHQADALAGAAARYPQYDAVAGALLNLEARINLCRQHHQELPPLAYESDELLALTAYVANLSQGRPLTVAVDGDAAPFFEQGRAYYFQRRGQLNLACNQCHDDNWGGKLRGDTISQGQPNAWPAYRLEWQTFGSLHRRIRDCDAGVRAEPHASGSGVYTSLELYLVWRARGLTLESPGVRR